MGCMLWRSTFLMFYSFRQGNQAWQWAYSSTMILSIQIISMGIAAEKASSWSKINDIHDNGEGSDGRILVSHALPYTHRFRLAQVWINRKLMAPVSLLWHKGLSILFKRNLLRRYARSAEAPWGRLKDPYRFQRLHMQRIRSSYWYHWVGSQRCRDAKHQFRCLMPTNKLLFLLLCFYKSDEEKWYGKLEYWILLKCKPWTAWCRMKDVLT